MNSPSAKTNLVDLYLKVSACARQQRGIRQLDVSDGRDWRHVILLLTLGYEDRRRGVLALLYYLPSAFHGTAFFV